MYARAFLVQLPSASSSPHRDGLAACHFATNSKLLGVFLQRLAGQRAILRCKAYDASADPAADAFSYPVAFDVRDLVTLEDVMEEMELGPNG